MGHSPEEGERVEPVPEATAPQQNLVVGTDAWVDALEHLPGMARGLRWQAKGHDGDEPTQGGVVGVCVGVDPSNDRKGPQPIVPLLLAGA
jgi:hypothetical protein